jgi:hypothetical protein
MFFEDSVEYADELLIQVEDMIEIEHYMTNFNVEKFSRIPRLPSIHSQIRNFSQRYIRCCAYIFKHDYNNLHHFLDINVYNCSVASLITEGLVNHNEHVVRYAITCTRLLSNYNCLAAVNMVGLIPLSHVFGGEFVDLRTRAINLIRKFLPFSLDNSNCLLPNFVIACRQLSTGEPYTSMDISHVLYCFNTIIEKKGIKFVPSNIIIDFTSGCCEQYGKQHWNDMILTLSIMSEDRSELIFRYIPLNIFRQWLVNPNRDHLYTRDHLFQMINYNYKNLEYNEIKTASFSEYLELTFHKILLDTPYLMSDVLKIYDKILWNNFPQYNNEVDDLVLARLIGLFLDYELFKFSCPILERFICSCTYVLTKKHLHASGVMDEIRVGDYEHLSNQLIRRLSLELYKYPFDVDDPFRLASDDGFHTARVQLSNPSSSRTISILQSMIYFGLDPIQDDDALFMNDLEKRFIISFPTEYECDPLHICECSRLFELRYYFNTENLFHLNEELQNFADEFIPVGYVRSNLLKMARPDFCNETRLINFFKMNYKYECIELNEYSSILEIFYAYPVDDIQLISRSPVTDRKYTHEFQVPYYNIKQRGKLSNYIERLLSILPPPENLFPSSRQMLLRYESPSEALLCNSFANIYVRKYPKWFDFRVRHFAAKMSLLPFPMRFVTWSHEISHEICYEEITEEFQRVQIHRENILEDGISILEMLGGSTVPLEFVFVDEPAIGPGVNIEFWTIFTNNIANHFFPIYNLEIEWMPRVNISKKDMYLLGVIMARTYIENIQCHFLLSKHFYDLLKPIHLRKNISALERLKDIDPVLHKTLTTTSLIGLPFLYPGVDTLELIENGENIYINNEEDQQKFVELVASTLCGDIFIETRGNNFLLGFNSVFIVENSFEIFINLYNDDELYNIFAGNLTITEYDIDHGILPSYGFSEDSKTFKNLLQILKTIDIETFQKFIIFVTAKKVLPFGGLRNLFPLITVSRLEVENNNPDTFLPTSQTCDHRLSIPQYSNIDILREQLLRVLEMPLNFGTV